MSRFKVHRRMSAAEISCEAGVFESGTLDRPKCLVIAVTPAR